MEDDQWDRLHIQIRCLQDFAALVVAISSNNDLFFHGESNE